MITKAVGHIPPRLFLPFHQPGAKTLLLPNSQLIYHMLTGCHTYDKHKKQPAIFGIGTTTNWSATNRNLFTIRKKEVGAVDPTLLTP